MLQVQNVLVVSLLSQALAATSADPAPSLRFSADASATLQSMNAEIARFQKMVTASSSHFETILQQQESQNKVADEINKKVDATNKALEAQNRVLEQNARVLIPENRKLRVELKNLKTAFRTAKAMAAAVTAFNPEGADKDDEISTGADLKTSLLIIASRDGAAGNGVQDLAKQERSGVLKLKKSFDAAIGELKRKNTELMATQHKMNATHVALEGRHRRLSSMVVHLQAAHTKLQNRIKTLSGFLQRLSSIASGGTGASSTPQKPPQQGQQHTKKLATTDAPATPAVTAKHMVVAAHSSIQAAPKFSPSSTRTASLPASHLSKGSAHKGLSASKSGTAKVAKPAKPSLLQQKAVAITPKIHGPTEDPLDRALDEAEKRLQR